MFIIKYYPQRKMLLTFNLISHEVINSQNDSINMA